MQNKQIEREFFLKFKDSGYDVFTMFFLYCAC